MKYIKLIRAMSNLKKFLFAFVVGLVFGLTFPIVFANAISFASPFPIVCIIGLAVPMMNPVANTIAYLHVILMTAYVYTSTNTYASTIQTACANTSITFMCTAFTFIFAQVFVLANRIPNIALVNMFGTRALAFALASIAMFGCNIAIVIVQP